MSLEKVQAYFDKFNIGISHNEETKKTKKKKFNPSLVDFDDANLDPIQTDINDSSYLFNNEDAISFNLNDKKPNN